MVQKMAETARRVALLRVNEALLSRKYKNQQMEARVNVEEMNKEAAAMEARSDFAIFVSTLTLISFRATKNWPAPSNCLVNHRLIFLAYGVVGITQAMAGPFVYLVIMASYGW